MSILLSLQKILCSAVEQNNFLQQHKFQFYTVPPKNNSFPLIVVNTLEVENQSCLERQIYQITLVLEVLTKGNSNQLCLQAMTQLQENFDFTHMSTLLSQENSQIELVSSEFRSGKIIYNTQNELCDGSLVWIFTINNRKI